MKNVLKYRVVRCSYYDQHLIKCSSWYEVEVLKKTLFGKKWVACTYRDYDWFGSGYSKIPIEFASAEEADEFINKVKSGVTTGIRKEIVEIF